MNMAIAVRDSSSRSAGCSAGDPARWIARTVRDVATRAFTFSGQNIYPEEIEQAVNMPKRVITDCLYESW